MPPLKLPKFEESGATVGYLYFSLIIAVGLALALRDWQMFAFAVLLLATLNLGASKDKGSVDKDLEGIGWTGKNTELAIPFGILGGLAAFFLASIVIRMTPENMGAVVPDMTANAKLFTASVVIPPALATGINIFSQVFVVAPSEESLKNVLAPYAANTILKSAILAIPVGLLVWIALHIPTFILNNTPNQMYLVLLIVGAITTAVYFLTQNLLSATIAHFTYNTGVILAGAGLDRFGFMALLLIIIVLYAAWLRSKK